MAHTFTQNVIHVVFSTKERHRTIAKDCQARLWAYIGGICRKEGIFIHEIGGMEDHVHILFQLPAALSLADAVLLIKANSSKWMNQKGHGFAWQRGYGAFSVSWSNLNAVVRYIRNQASHHRKMNFDQEFLALLEKHGVKFDLKYVFG
jgi:putative transposase